MNRYRKPLVVVNPMCPKKTHALHVFLCDRVEVKAKGTKQQQQ